MGILRIVKILGKACCCRMVHLHHRRLDMKKSICIFGCTGTACYVVKEGIVKVVEWSGTE